MAEEVAGCEAPIDAVEAKMFAQPVFELVFGIAKTLDILDVLVNTKSRLGGKLWSGGHVAVLRKPLCFQRPGLPRNLEVARVARKVELC